MFSTFMGSMLILKSYSQPQLSSMGSTSHRMNKGKDRGHSQPEGSWKSPWCSTKLSKLLKKVISEVLNQTRYSLLTRPWLLKLQVYNVHSSWSWSVFLCLFFIHFVLSYLIGFELRNISFPLYFFFQSFLITFSFWFVFFKLK